MRRVSRLPCILAACIFAFCAAIVCAARASGTTSTPETKVSLTRLSPPVYPFIARHAYITGDLLLRVEVSQDGAVLSVSVESGPALQILREAAVDSAKHSQFECLDCGEAPTVFQMTYTFRLEDPKDPCADMNLERSGQNGVKPYPHVDYSADHVTVIDLSVSTCDPAAPMRTRSMKCLYLWRCATGPVSDAPGPGPSR
jgi:TonB family protein